MALRRSERERSGERGVLGVRERMALVARMEPLGADGFNEDAALGVVDDPVPYAVARRSVDFTLYPQDPADPISDPDFCLYTLIAQSRSQVNQTKIFSTLVRMHHENYGTMDPFGFVRMMQTYYNKFIRHAILIPAADGSHHKVKWADAPAWPADRIWNYTLHAVVHPMAVREDVARTFRDALSIMADNMMFLYNPVTKKRTVDLKVLDVYCKTYDKSRMLFDKLEGSRSTSIYTL